MAMMIMFLRILPPFSFPGGDSNENCINVNGDGNDTSIDINDTSIDINDDDIDSEDYNENDNVNGNDDDWQWC